MMFRHVVFEIHDWTDKQTDKHDRRWNNN